MNHEVETEILGLLIDCGPPPTGFSVVYAELHAAGITQASSALTLLLDLEKRGFVRIRRHTQDAAGRHKWKVASKTYREGFLREHERLFEKLRKAKAGPRWDWDPDLDYGDFNLHFEVTDEGRAEYLRREGPTDEASAWRAELGDELVVWATTERNARRVARRLVRQAVRAPEAGRVACRKREVEPARFELATGELFDGVRVTYGLHVVEQARR